MSSSVWKGPWRYDTDDAGVTTIRQRPCFAGMDLKARSDWGQRIELIGFGDDVDGIIEPGAWPESLTMDAPPYLTPPLLTQPLESVPMTQPPVSTIGHAGTRWIQQDDGSLKVFKEEA